MEQASLPLVENEYGGEYAQMSDLEGGRASSRPSLPRPSQGGRRTTMGLSRERVTVSRVTVGRSTRITQHDADLLNRPTTTAGEDMGGLSSEEAARRLEQYGRNEVAEQETSILWMFLKQFLGMMPFAITVCFILAIIATVCSLPGPRSRESCHSPRITSIASSSDLC